MPGNYLGFSHSALQYYLKQCDKNCWFYHPPNSPGRVQVACYVCEENYWFDDVLKTAIDPKIDQFVSKHKTHKKKNELYVAPGKIIIVDDVEQYLAVPEIISHAPKAPLVAQPIGRKFRED